MKQQMMQYMEKCESFENDYSKFSLYVHGYWLPHLQQLVEQGLLKQGTTTFTIDENQFTYEGFLNEKGEAYG